MGVIHKGETMKSAGDLRSRSCFAGGFFTFILLAFAFVLTCLQRVEGVAALVGLGPPQVLR
jgi:hypothetical protein